MVSMIGLNISSYNDTYYKNIQETINTPCQLHHLNYNTCIINIHILLLFHMHDKKVALFHFMVVSTNADPILQG